jgi:hypothetical protein
VFTGRSLFCALLIAASAACAACMVPASFRPGVGKARHVSLRFEGTCAQLACCSAYAVAVPAQSPGAFRCDQQSSAACRKSSGWFAPGFTCDPREKGRYRQPDDPPYLDCNDQERWLSLPNLGSAECGETYLVCRQGVRVTAIARDRSAGNDSGRTHYEGSLGLWRALGADLNERETFVSVYPLYERDLIASDPDCVGSGR